MISECHRCRRGSVRRRDLGAPAAAAPRSHIANQLGERRDQARQSAAQRGGVGVEDAHGDRSPLNDRSRARCSSPGVGDTLIRRTRSRTLDSSAIDSARSSASRSQRPLVSCSAATPGSPSRLGDHGARLVALDDDAHPGADLIGLGVRRGARCKPTTIWRVSSLRSRFVTVPRETPSWRRASRRWCARRGAAGRSAGGRCRPSPRRARAGGASEPIRPRVARPHIVAPSSQGTELALPVAVALALRRRPDAVASMSRVCCRRVRRSSPRRR